MVAEDLATDDEFFYVLKHGKPEHLLLGKIVEPKADQETKEYEEEITPLEEVRITPSLKLTVLAEGLATFKENKS